MLPSPPWPRPRINCSMLCAMKNVQNNRKTENNTPPVDLYTARHNKLIGIIHSSHFKLPVQNTKFITYYIILKIKYNIQYRSSYTVMVMLTQPVHSLLWVIWYKHWHQQSVNMLTFLWPATHCSIWQIALSNLSFKHQSYMSKVTEVTNNFETGEDWWKQDKEEKVWGLYDRSVYLSVRWFVCRISWKVVMDWHEIFSERTLG